jgi:hypothetical protein
MAHEPHRRSLAATRRTRQRARCQRTYPPAKEAQEDRQATRQAQPPGSTQSENLRQEAALRCRILRRSLPWQKARSAVPADNVRARGSAGCTRRTQRSRKTGNPLRLRDTDDSAQRGAVDSERHRAQGVYRACELCCADGTRHTPVTASRTRLQAVPRHQAVLATSRSASLRTALPIASGACESIAVPAGVSRSAMDTSSSVPRAHLE